VQVGEVQEHEPVEGDRQMRDFHLMVADRLGSLARSGSRTGSANS
jgi:hypothetical protein